MQLGDHGDFEIVPEVTGIIAAGKACKVSGCTASAARGILGPQILSHLSKVIRYTLGYMVPW